jgi:hypothetical protein
MQTLLPSEGSSGALKTMVGIFLGLLVLVHCGSSEELLDLPLSMLRESDRALLAYSLFAVLLLIGVIMIRAALALGNGTEVGIYSAAAVGLAVTALTPTFSPLHGLSTTLVLGVMCARFAMLLVLDEGRRLRMYSVFAAVPLFVASFHSYGLGQKGMITYFVLAMAVRHHDLWQAHDMQIARRKPRPRCVCRPEKHIYIEN